MSQTIIIPSMLESYRSLKDKTLKITFETNELNPQDLLNIIEHTGQFGYLAFKREPFGQEEKKYLDALESDFLEQTSKTPSQRLRAVFYRLYEQDRSGFDSFELYYSHHMEKLVNHFKSKLQ
jgi:hypothetical protein